MRDAVIKIENLPHYFATFDADRKLVHVELRGHWDAPLSERFEREFRQALKQLAAAGCRIGEQRMLVDLSAFGVQSQDANRMFEQLSTDPSIAPSKTAMVVESMLLKFQVQRVAPDYEIFTDRAAARAWLGEASG